MQPQKHLHLQIQNQIKKQAAAARIAFGWLPRRPQGVQTQFSQWVSTFSTEFSTGRSKAVEASDFLANVHRTFSKNLDDFSK